MPRVESSLFQYDKHIGSLQEAQVRMAETHKRLSNDNRIGHLNDDFSGISTTLPSSLLKAEVEAFEKEVQVGKQVLDDIVSNLTEMHQLLIDAKQKSVQAIETSAVSDIRKQVANEIVFLQQRFVEIANAKDTKHQFLFANIETDPTTSLSPYEVVNGTLLCNALALDNQAEIGINGHNQIATQFTEAFAKVYQDLESLKNNLLQGNISAVRENDLTNLDLSLSALSIHQDHIRSGLRELEHVSTNNERRISEFSKEIDGDNKLDLFTETEKCMQTHNCLLTAFSSIKDALHTNFMLPSFING